MKNKTILAKIGISDNDVLSWKKEGLKITFPMRKNKKFYKSDDGTIFIEGADKYVIPLSKIEVSQYIKNPEKFKEDFLKNLKLYKQFCLYLQEYIFKANFSDHFSKSLALLSFFYLFQVGMDHHYYHFDRYLVYENYPQTPVGFWWAKAKDLYLRILGKSKMTNALQLGFLDLFSDKNQSIASQLRKKADDKSFHELQDALRKIKIFEAAQKEEIELCTDQKNKQIIFFQVGLPIWSGLQESIVSTEVVKKAYLEKVKEILNKHPINGVRYLLDQVNLNKYFTDNLKKELEAEIKRWI